MNFLQSFPEQQELLSRYKNEDLNPVPEVNGHIHTPFSFSAFENVEQIFALAKEEDIKILGINDFYVTDGYDDFHRNALENNIFPLFNIEFIGLLTKEQKQNIKVNDPNNPGRTYFSGKGLNYPFKLSTASAAKIDRVRQESQAQVKEMVNNTNALLKNINAPFILDYGEIKQKYARELVRERHIAKALRIAIHDNFSSDTDKQDFIRKLYSGKEIKSDINNNNAFENEIRGYLLKAGGAAFVPEDEKAFLPVEEIIKIIIDAGGIPCYPLLLDDKNGNYTGFEADYNLLYDRLQELGVSAVELIPGRNDAANLKKFVRYFSDKGFLITFGTEHNTPELIPMKVVTRDNRPLDKELKMINFEGACIIAAHQYLQAKGMEGYTQRNGKAKITEKEDFIQLGKAVFKHYFQQ